VLAGAGLLAGLAWAYLVAGAGMGMSALAMTRVALFPHLDPMGAMAMPGMAALPAALPIVVAMWWVMMTAMMLPSAVPVMLLHAQVVRHGQSRGQLPPGPAPTAAFLAGYLTVWLGFSIVAALLQWLLQEARLVTPMLWSGSAWLSGGLLALAGLYQLSPMKQVCLRHCQSPAGFLGRKWRPGRLGAFRLGLGHGAWCLGCCWALMALLFVGGVMNLVWIAVLALLVLAEKLARPGRGARIAVAALLIAWGMATLALA
jgi:predicted metal-binding membrane protein